MAAATGLVGAAIVKQAAPVAIPEEVAIAGLRGALRQGQLWSLRHKVAFAGYGPGRGTGRCAAAQRYGREGLGSQLVRLALRIVSILVLHGVTPVIAIFIKQ
jgi:hypothetical protein